jgi:2-hydroxy-6-oxonona-2,4-dienedioate hydrolase
MRRILALASLVLAAGAAMVGLAYTTDLARAHARATAGGLVVTTPCGPIEFAGAGAGPPLLLIHGAGGGFDQGLLFGRRLLDEGVQIIAPSRFGYLRTPVPDDASAEAQADAHACLLDALGIERVAVLGASAGAPSAMQFCIRHPARCEKLILLVPAAYAPVHAGQTMRIPPSLEFVVEHVLTSDFALWALIKARPRLLVRTMFGTPAEVFDAASAEDRAAVLDALMSVEPVSRRTAGLAIDAQVTSNLPRYELERIRAPALLLSLQDDLYGTWENARYTSEQIPGSRFVSYASGGHVWIGHDEGVWHEVARFIKPPAPSPWP